jgi:CBS domain-containing protein
MRVEQLMSQPAVTCRSDDSLHTAARLMWDHDCGALPVVGDGGKVVGVITDRDACMAAYTQGLPLQAVPVSRAMSRQVFSCRPDQAIEAAEKLMAEKQVRRLPVLDGEGRPVGMLSLNDVAREAASRPGNGLASDVAKTLGAIGQPPPHAIAAIPHDVAQARVEMALTAV